MKPARLKQLPWREIDSRAIIIHPAMGQVHELDEVATFLWKSADGSLSIDELAVKLTANFEVGLEEALQDTREFFADLTSQGLIL